MENKWNGTVCKLQKGTNSKSYWYVKFCLAFGLCVQVKGAPQSTCFDITTRVFNAKTTQHKDLLFQVTLHRVLLNV